MVGSVCCWFEGACKYHDCGQVMTVAEVPDGFDVNECLAECHIDAHSDAHQYRAENPLTHLHEDEAPVDTDRLKCFGMAMLQRQR